MNIQIGEWNFEVIEVAARKCDKFGDSFTGSGRITIADGEPHIQSLIIDGGVTKSDMETLVKYLTIEGFKYYISCKIIDGKRELIKTVINNKVR